MVKTSDVQFSSSTITNFKKVIGCRICGQRKKYGLTQNNLAQIFNEAGFKLSTVTVSSWECGRKNPNLEEIKFLSKYFDVSVDYLTGVSDKESVPLYKIQGNSFGKKFRHIRRKRHYTQERIAKELGVFIGKKYHGPNISDWENDNARPGLKTICMIAIFFDVNVEDLVA